MPPIHCLLSFCEMVSAIRLQSAMHLQNKNINKQKILCVTLTLQMAVPATAAVTARVRQNVLHRKYKHKY